MLLLLVSLEFLFYIGLIYKIIDNFSFNDTIFIMITFLRRIFIFSICALIASSITGCSTPAGPINGNDIVSFAAKNFKSLGFAGDSVTTKALCDTTPLNSYTKTEFIKGTVDLCKATTEHTGKGKGYGTIVESVAVSLGRVPDLGWVCRELTNQSITGLASYNRFMLTRPLPKSQKHDLDAGEYLGSLNIEGVGLVGEVKSGLVSFTNGSHGDRGTKCVELVDYLKQVEGSILFITYPAIINTSGETLWMQAVLSVQESGVVYTNGDNYLRPDFFPIFVDAFNR